jgi:mono/diheme cytochrome c family protein
MRLRALTALLLLLTAACTGQADPNASGAELYAQFCARCHGADLAGGVGQALGPGSELVEKPDSYVIAVLEDGRGSMPAFGNTLSADQIQSVLDFIRMEQRS